MPIQFERGRWDDIAETYSRWWSGKLERPLIYMTITGNDPGRPKPVLPLHDHLSNYDFSISAERIIDCCDYHLNTRRFLGDGFPAFWPNFGPGVMAAFLGARVEAHPATTWFHAPDDKEISNIRFAYDPLNPWLKRVKDVTAAAIEHWQGNVQVGMTDLGGTLDIAATFRPSEKVLIDTCIYPEEVKRLSWEIHDLWLRYFDEIDALMRPLNRGYTAWTPIFSKEPYYMLQCDFSYMIGPGMFDELVKPELAAACKKLTHAFYHLDGVGALAHLDSLLKIEELKGVQWIPGDGQPDCSHWAHVYRKILDAGKVAQVTHGDMQAFDRLVDQLGSARGLVFFTDCDASREQEALEFVQKYGATKSASAKSGSR